MTLDSADVGQKARLLDFKENESVYLKFISLGVLPGDEIEVLGKAPFGGPISLKHGDDIFFALRRSEAKKIKIEL